MNVGFEPDHAGDRVWYAGRAYRVSSLNRRTHLAELAADDGEPGFIPAVNFDNLEPYWCPESHGGTGKPAEVNA